MSISLLKKLRLFSIAATLLGVAALFWSGRYFAGHRLQAARFAVELGRGKETHAKFRADFSATYAVELGVAPREGSLPLRIKCALGIERPKWEKCEAPTALDVSWAVYSGNARIAGDRVQGGQDPTLWSGLATRTLGWFAAKQGASYRVAITSHRDVRGAFDPEKPEVLVRLPEAAVAKDGYSGWKLLREASLILAAGALSLTTLLTLACLL